jgi:4-hydroxy-2-oxoheptanedioate aldolase
MRPNTALAKWRAGIQTIGGWLSLANTHSAESLAHAGFDWIVVDMQHGLIDMSDLRVMLPAISTSETTPLVRVTWNNPAEIMKALDAGAMGVIVPMINNRAEAEAAIAATKYPPQGMRSFGPIRAALYGGQGYAAEANDQITCIAMVETREGLDNLEEIVSTPGLGGVYIGPADLALAIGLPPVGDNEHPLHLQTIERIRDVCKKYKVPVGIHSHSLKFTQQRLALGFDFVLLGNDVGFMMQAATTQLAAARGSAQKARENTGY